MKDIENFVHRLFKSSPLTKQDQETIKTVIEMLKEKVEDLKEEGMTEEDAIHKTIVEFGELDDFYHPDMEKEKKHYHRIKTMNHYKNDLLFSALSSVLIISILAVINFVFFSHYGPWFIIPSLGVLFWPLSLLYKFLNKRGD